MKGDITLPSDTAKSLALVNLMMQGMDLNESASEETKARAIEFPLYARALDFCAAHHDSFVRVTAMNICLNTLREQVPFTIQNTKSILNSLPASS